MPEYNHIRHAHLNNAHINVTYSKQTIKNTYNINKGHAVNRVLPSGRSIGGFGDRHDSCATNSKQHTLDISNEIHGRKTLICLSRGCVCYSEVSKDMALHVMQMHVCTSSF